MDIQFQYIERSKLLYVEYQNEEMKAAPPYSLDIELCFSRCLDVDGFVPTKFNAFRGTSFIAMENIQSAVKACEALLNVVCPSCDADAIEIKGDYKGFQTVVTFHLINNKVTISMDASSAKPPLPEFFEKFIPYIDDAPLLGAGDNEIELVIETGRDGLWIAKYYADWGAYKFMPLYSMPIKDTLDNIFQIPYLNVYQTCAFVGEHKETFSDSATTGQIEDFCKNFFMQRIHILAYYLGGYMATIKLYLCHNRVVVSMAKEEDPEQYNLHRLCDLADKVALAVWSASPRFKGKNIDCQFKHEFVGMASNMDD